MLFSVPATRSSAPILVKMASSSDDVLCVVETIKTEPNYNCEEETSNIDYEDSTPAIQSTNKDILKDIYYKKLIDYDDYRSGFGPSSRNPWTRKRIAEIIAELETKNKKPRNSYWSKVFRVVTTADEKYLIKKNGDLTLRIVPREEYYDILKKVHTEIGYGDQYKLISTIKSKYFIPQKAISIYLSLDPEKLPKGYGTKNISYDHANHNGILSLIDFQSCRDGEYKWLLIYKNDGTKFVSMRPLKTISTKEVTTELLKVLLTMGKPVVLKSNLHIKFMGIICDELYKMWPDCKLKLEKTNEDDLHCTKIENILRELMKENNCANWSTKCYFVEYYMNTSFNDNLECKPYEALFGCTPKFDLKTFSNLVETNTNRNENSKQINKQLEQVVNTENLNWKSQCYLGKNDLPQTAVQTSLSRDQDIKNDDAFKCKFCNNNAIIICGITDDKEGQKLNVTCYTCKTVQDMAIPINKPQKRVGYELELENSKKMTYGLNIGQSVAVSIPKVHQGPMNLETIKGKIVDIQNGVFRIATRTGTLKNWFCKEDLEPIAYCGLVSDLPISLEEAVLNQSIPADWEDQTTKCNCKPAVNQCRGNRCVCLKAKKNCGLQCHHQLPCLNT